MKIKQSLGYKQPRLVNRCPTGHRVVHASRRLCVLYCAIKTNKKKNAYMLSVFTPNDQHHKAANVCEMPLCLYK